MPGIRPSFVVIADTDGLIATLHEEDRNFARAKETLQKLLQMDAQLIFPLTTIVETITTLTRKLSQPKLAEQVIEAIARGELVIEPADKELLDNALGVFKPDGSKQNTLFDAMVVATAKKFGTDYIFSFDDWYKKLDYHLVTDFIAEDPKAA